MLFYDPAPDVLVKAVHFPAHQARLDEFQRRGELLAVGTWADPRQGSMVVLRTRAAAEAFVAGDPFVANGVVARHEIRDWDEVLLPG